MSDYDPAFSDIETQMMIAETEREIMNDALGVDDPEEDMPSNLIDDQSRIEGWQGHLNDDELIQTTAFGHMQDGFDRPLAHREDMEAAAQNEQLRQQLAERDQQILELLDQTGPVHRGPQQAQQQQQQSAPGSGC